jgi:hypothetical protein
MTPKVIDTFECDPALVGRRLLLSMVGNQRPGTGSGADPGTVVEFETR